MVRVAEDALKRTAGADNLLFGIEYDHDAVGSVQNRGDEIPLGVKLDVKLANLVIAAGQL